VQSGTLEGFIRSTELTSKSKQRLSLTPEATFVNSRTGTRIPMRSASRSHTRPKRLEDYMISNPLNCMEAFARDNEDDFLDVMSIVFGEPDWRRRYEPSKNLPVLPST
jgi:hypothetical protein